MVCEDMYRSTQYCYPLFYCTTVTPIKAEIQGKLSRIYVYYRFLKNPNNQSTLQVLLGRTPEESISAISISAFVADKSVLNL